MRSRSLLIAALLVASTASTATVDTAPRVTIVTNDGTFTARMLPAAAPQTVAQFMRMVNAGVYDSVYFFRVEKRFVAQTASADDRAVPMTAKQRATIEPLPVETQKRLRHTRGVLSMAHGDDLYSGDSSFSIVLGDAPHLDGKFTIFGRLEGGDAELRALEKKFDKKARDKSGKRLQIIRISASR
jgi:cyclophilin family peptidyl-prolyl cis-trans isomerase